MDARESQLSTQGRTLAPSWWWAAGWAIVVTGMSIVVFYAGSRLVAYDALSESFALLLGGAYAGATIALSLATLRRRSTAILAWAILSLLVTGTVTAMFFVGGDAAWQRVSLSALGGVYSHSPVLFNATMICAALAVLCLGSIMFHPEARMLPAHGPLMATRRRMRASTAILCAQFIVIGTIPYNRSSLDYWVHTAAGWGSAVVFVAAMGLSRRYFPTFDEAFHTRSQIFAGIITLTALLHRPGFVLPLMWTELIISVLVLTWAGWFVASWVRSGEQSAAPAVAAGAEAS